MSPKAKAGKAAPAKESHKAPKKESAKEVSKEKKADKKSAKAAAKGEAKVEAKAEGEGEAPAVDLEELEEAAEESAAASQNSNAAALAAATGGTSELSTSFKNFRHHPDMENFYRFIYENDLRHEALAIIDTIISEKAQRKAAKHAKH